MGDMADFINDSYEHWGEEPRYSRREPTRVLCKYCAEECVWGVDGFTKRWILCCPATGKSHKCKAKFKRRD